MGTPSTTSTAPHRTGLPLWGLAALSTAAFTAVLTELLPAGMLPQLAAGLRVPPARIGFLVTVYAVASAAAAIPLTAALRGQPRRRVLLGALAGFGLSNLAVALAPAYPVAVAARLVAGVMGGALWALLAGYAARMVAPDRRGRAIAVVLAGNTVALCVGVPVGTAVAATVGWRTGFAALAGLAALLVVWVRAKVPPFPGETADGVPLRRVAMLPGVAAVLSVTLLLLVGHQTVYTYLVPLSARRATVAPGVALAVFGIATVAGIWVAGMLVDRQLRVTLAAGLALAVVAMAGLGLAGTAPVLLPVAVAAWGVVFGAAPTLIQTALVGAAGTANADAATSLQATVYNLGIAGGSFLGGLVLSGAGVGALPWVAAPLLAGALATVLLARRHAFPAG